MLFKFFTAPIETVSFLQSDFVLDLLTNFVQLEKNALVLVFVRVGSRAMEKCFSCHAVLFSELCLNRVLSIFQKDRF